MLMMAGGAGVTWWLFVLLKQTIFVKDKADIGKEVLGVLSGGQLWQRWGLPDGDVRSSLP